MVRIDQIPPEHRAGGIRSHVLDGGRDGAIVMTNGEVGSVTHRDMRRDPDDWEHPSRGSSRRDRKVLQRFNRP